MKVWILLALLIVGCVTFEVRADDDDDDNDNEDVSEEGSSAGENDDDGGDDDDDGFENNSNGDDENNDYVVEEVCGHFNLEICIHYYINSDEYHTPQSDDPLCWESYVTMQCMHDYAKECFPNDETTEDYLCKLRYFMDRIELLCLNETEGHDDDEAVLEEALKCLEGAEEDAEECVTESIPKIKEMFNEKKSTLELTDMDAIKCLLASQIMECTTDRLKLRCDEEIVEAFREGAEEGLAEVMGDVCKDKVHHDVVSLK